MLLLKVLRKIQGQGFIGKSGKCIGQLTLGRNNIMLLISWCSQTRVEQFRGVWGGYTWLYKNRKYGGKQRKLFIYLHLNLHTNLGKQSFKAVKLRRDVQKPEYIGDRSITRHKQFNYSLASNSSSFAFNEKVLQSYSCLLIAQFKITHDGRNNKLFRES